MAFHKKRAVKEGSGQQICKCNNGRKRDAGSEILNINGIIREIADHGNVDSAAMGDCRCAARGT